MWRRNGNEDNGNHKHVRRQGFSSSSSAHANKTKTTMSLNKERIKGGGGGAPPGAACGGWTDLEMIAATLVAYGLSVLCVVLIITARHGEHPHGRWGPHDPSLTSSSSSLSLSRHAAQQQQQSPQERQSSSSSTTTTTTTPTSKSWPNAGRKKETFKLPPVELHATKSTSSSSSSFHTAREESASAKSSLGSSEKAQLQLQHFRFDRAAAEARVQETKTSGAHPFFQTLTAHVEDPSTLDDEIPGTGWQGTAKPADGREQDRGMPPDFRQPLPLRTSATPAQLQVFTYPSLASCHDLPAQWPVDQKVHVPHRRRNVNNKQVVKDVLAEAVHCPVHADPFLPWIHDVFPSTNGAKLHFIAQNKRRCNTGIQFLDEIKRLEPQLSLLQPISLQRITHGEARRLAPELWNPEKDKTNPLAHLAQDLPRYRLAPHEEASKDGQYTRFLCRFHTKSRVDGHVILLGETLSEYPINYEFANYRKGVPPTMITPRGMDNKFFWLSNFRFDCPIPDNGNLRQAVASGEVVLDDGVSTVYVDVVPVRTSPRFGIEQVYFSEALAGPRPSWGSTRLQAADPFGWRRAKNVTQIGFDAAHQWGHRHVLPPVEASGRWSNIPICQPPVPRQTTTSETFPQLQSLVEKPHEPWHQTATFTLTKNEEEAPQKPHTLVACLWASASFATRGNQKGVKDTPERLVEWITYNLLVGFDHVYVYDNTGAHTNETSLQPLLEHYFTPAEVTRIDWPHRVCNNNIPAHENTGERSSQYAAEASCRQRFGPFTEWMAVIDTDEYLIPMGDFQNLKQVVQKASDEGMAVLSFRSTRAYPNAAFLEEYYDLDHMTCGGPDSSVCLTKRPSALFLETYNCDFEPIPKPQWAMRAKKQIFKPDYVLTHFVHYATIGKGLMQRYDQATDETEWMARAGKDEPLERFTNEVSEAVMLHTKTTSPDDTVDWKQRCRLGFSGRWHEKCRVGFPFPDNDGQKGVANPEGMEYNCFTNEKLTHLWIPRLRQALQTRKQTATAAAAASQGRDPQ